MLVSLDTSNEKLPPLRWESMSHRNRLLEYFNYPIKRKASYMKDVEVLTTNQTPKHVISDSIVIQLIRFIYLLKICKCFTSEAFNFVNDIYTGEKFIDIMDISEDREGFLFIWNYLLEDKNIQNEREYYKKFEEYDKSVFVEYLLNDYLVNFFDEIKKDKYSRIFDAEFLDWLIENSMLLDSYKK